MDAIEKFRVKFPQLEIVIDPSELLEEVNDDLLSDGVVHINAEDHSEDDHRVDADAVLREIVDRKCRMQSLNYFNIDTTVQV